MHCASCVSRVEGELARVPGVIEANVSLTAEEATVRYAPGHAQPPAFEEAVARAGYKARPAAAPEDALTRQEDDRRREYATLMRKFWFAAADRRAGDGLLLPGPARPRPLGGVREGLRLAAVDLAPAWAGHDPRARLGGLAVLHRRLAGAPPPHREHAHADRGRHLRRLAVLDGRGALARRVPGGALHRGLLRRQRRGGGAGHAGAGARGEGQGPLLGGDPQAGRPAGQDRARHPRRRGGRGAGRRGRGRRRGRRPPGREGARRRRDRRRASRASTSRWSPASRCPWTRGPATR